MAKKMLLNTFILTIIIGNIFLWDYVYEEYKSMKSDSKSSITEQASEVSVNEKDSLTSIKNLSEESTNNLSEESTNNLNELDKIQLKNNEDITRYLNEMIALDDQLTMLLDKSAKLAFTVGDGNLSSFGYEHYMWKEILPEIDIITSKVVQIIPPTELQEIHESYIDVTNYYDQALLVSIPTIKDGDELKLSRHVELTSKAEKSRRDFFNKIIPMSKEYNFEAEPPIDYSNYQYIFSEPYNPEPQESPTINIKIVHEYVEYHRPMQSGTFNLPPGIEVKRY